MLQTVLSMILTEWLWYVFRSLSELHPDSRIRVHASIFQNDCSPDIQYVLFVVKANALGSGRIVSLILTSALMAGYFAITFHELRAYHHSYKQSKIPRPHRQNSSDSTDEKVTNLASPTSVLSSNAMSTPPISHIEFNRSPSFNAPTSNHNKESSSRPSAGVVGPNGHPRNPATTKTTRPRRKQWSGNWDPMLLGIAAFQFVVFTYFIVSTELLLQWNPYNTDGNKWGFGQV